MSLLVLKKLPQKYASFTELDHIHQIADELLIQHQVHSMEADWINALVTMDAIFHLRMGNMQDEEELLLPVYESILPDIPDGGAIKYFLRENKLIRGKLNQMIRQISRKVQNPDQENFSLVRLFEDYHRFKDLLDHHDARERAFLYKYLDEESDNFNSMEILKTIEGRQSKMLQELQSRV